MSKRFFSDLDSIRKAYYEHFYISQSESWAQIAERLNTYPNKVRRDATKLGVRSRDKSTAQKVAISEGRHEHPTEGKSLSEETKARISESQGKVWDSMTQDERVLRSQIGKESWNKKTAYEKTTFFKKSTEAIQEASRNGSKVELMLHEKLNGCGYDVQKHQEHMLQNEKFHIDLYIPHCRTAIEVDGPLHFEPVFGEEKLQRRQAADQEKTGLILSSGMVLIRVKLTKRESQRYLRHIWERVQEVIQGVENSFPPEHERYFEV